MHTSQQRLPLDVQSFELMREGHYVYVDKTRYIHQMLMEGRYFFLSRPRRFGKSLLISTLQCLFQGKKDLFEGLWIVEHGDWDWQPYPVIALSFTDLSSRTSERLEQSLLQQLQYIAEIEGATLRAPFLELQFHELIAQLAQKTGQPVVVLIDEYDKPIIEHLGRDLGTAKANRDVLKSFFGVLKSIELAPILRFVFLTGISRFSKVSIFSELNNLRDLSMLKHYTAILGWTQEEVEASFSDYLDCLAESFACTSEEVRRKLARQYNGYRFSVQNTRVYNPFSLLNAFANLDFEDYWFESAIPSFLTQLLEQVKYPLPTLEGMRVSRSVFNTFDLDYLRPEALLFQTGYLTIVDVQHKIYTLDYPNNEVKRAFSESLLFSLTRGSSPEISSHVLQLSTYLEQENLEAFIETMRAIFASIPYDIESKRDEAYFHTIFYLMLTASGVDAQSSVLTCKGRIDLAISCTHKVYIIEFKCGQSAQHALQQIDHNNYATKYRQSGKKIFLMGINFDPEQRNLAEWLVREDG